MAQSNNAKTLKIGAVLSLTGDAAVHGEAMRKGISLASEDLKSQGWTVEVNFQDDGTKPVKTISSLQYLLSQNYRLFVGPTWSFLTKAATPLLEKYEAVALLPAGSSDINGGPSKSLLNLCPNRIRQLAITSEWLKSRSFKKALVLTPLGDWGIVHRAVFQKAALEAGIEVVADEQIEYGIEPVALSAILLKAKSKGVDLLLTTSSGGDIFNMLKLRSKLQWQVGMLTTENLWDNIDQELISADDPMLKDAWVLGLPLNLKFSQRFQERFHESPKMNADRGYDALMLLAKAAQATDGSPSQIRLFLTRGEPYSGVTGEIKFNDLGDRMSEEFKIMQGLSNKERT